VNSTEHEVVEAAGDDAIRSLVARLGRPHPSGATVIERAAILAAGADSHAILDWIEVHGGEPEFVATAPARHGLHGSLRHVGGADDSRPPVRFLVPPGALD
jgi:hypothetical protein